MSHTTTPDTHIRHGRGRRRRATRGLVASYIHEVSLRAHDRAAQRVAEPFPVSVWAPGAAMAEAACRA